MLTPSKNIRAERLTGSLDASGIDISGSLSITGSFSGSFQGDGSGLTGIVSSSYALTASYLDNYIPPFPYTGSAEITGSLIVTGSLLQNASTASFAGLVGIGTTTPSSKLDVRGEIISLNSSTSGIKIQNTFSTSNTTSGISITRPSSGGTYFAGNGNINVSFLSQTRTNTYAQTTAEIQTRAIRTIYGATNDSGAYTTNQHEFHVGNVFSGGWTASTLRMVINGSGNVGIGTGASTPAARLDVFAQGALSTDVAFRVRNSADDRNLFSVLGNGDIEVRTNKVSLALSTRLSIGGSNSDNAPDSSGYVQNVILGFNNTNSGLRSTVIGSGNSSNNSNSPATTIGYANSNKNNGVVVGHSNTLGGIVLGSSNTGGAVGRTAIIGDNNTVSVANGNPTQPMFLLGNGVTLPNLGAINNCVFLSAGNNATAPFNTFKNDNLLIGSLTPWTTNFDNSSRGVFYTKNGTAPTTLAADTFGMYSADITAGNAAPHFRTENGSIIKLYQQSAVTSSQGLADVLTNVGLLSGSSVISSTAPSGPFGIADTSGSYTYYTTFSASIAAATSGQTVEMFADVTETGSVTVTLKNGVNINGNGHTYTLNNTGSTHALTAANSSTTSCNILNLNVVRTGSTGTLSNNSALTLGVSGTGVINCAGSTFRNLGSGCGVLFNTNSTHEINYAVAYATTTNGAFGMFTSAGAKLNNSIGYGTSGGIGIRCHNGGDIQNCTGVSDSSYGIYGLSGNQSNSIGVSATGNGFFVASTAFNCVGRSTSGIGFECVNGVNIVGCVGISVSGRGLTSQNATTHNCTGISSSSSGVSLGGNGKSYNITAKSSTSYALWGTVTTQQLYGGTIVCRWNNAAGYGIRGNGGTILSAIVNCTFNLSNASAPYLFNDNIAQAITMRGNTYQGGAAFNANLTQATVATQDNQGNIFL